MKRFTLITAAIALILVSIALFFYGDEKEPAFKDGDIIFHTSLSAQSKAIQLATKSPYSHCGIIVTHKGGLYVYEAVQPVKFTPLQEWITRGKDAKYVVKRLKNAEAILTPAALEKMQKEGQKFLGKNYDLRFEWSDDKIYCSELIWKIYKRALNIELGTLQKIGDFDLSAPAVQQKVNERYAGKVPLNESIITPVAVFDSDKLFTVYQN